MKTKFSYHFFPVGQGLFSAGKIYRLDSSGSEFHWVYDCGTSSSQKLIDAGLTELSNWAGKPRTIDLLALSHFDRDHISGVVRLLGKFKVRTLMLPYMYLPQRLLLAMEEELDDPDEPLSAFFLDPVTYLLSLDGVDIDEILFVPPSGNEGPAYPPEVNSPTDGPDRSATQQGVPEWLSQRDDAQSLIDATTNNGKSTRVSFLQPGTRYGKGPKEWEFIPYNDDPPTPIDDDFVKAVESKRNALLSSKYKKERDTALAELKGVYDDLFGKSPKRRNMISLFLYVGPFYFKKQCHNPLQYEARSYSPWRSERLGHCLSHDLSWIHFHDGWEGWNRSRCSILYSGDGYLDTEAKLRRMIAYFHEKRIARVGVFQVMHHGAKDNWWDGGVADKIKPWFSVFSSDPTRKRLGHPNAPVLRDFWAYGAVQVDKARDFGVCGFVPD